MKYIDKQLKFVNNLLRFFLLCTAIILIATGIMAAPAQALMTLIIAGIILLALSSPLWIIKNHLRHNIVYISFTKQVFEWIRAMLWIFTSIATIIIVIVIATQTNIGIIPSIGIPIAFALTLIAFFIHIGKTAIIKEQLRLHLPITRILLLDNKKLTINTKIKFDTNHVIYRKNELYFLLEASILDKNVHPNVIHQIVQCINKTNFKNIRHDPNANLLIETSEKDIKKYSTKTHKEIDAFIEEYNKLLDKNESDFKNNSHNYQKTLLKQLLNNPIMPQSDQKTTADEKKETLKKLPNSPISSNTGSQHTINREELGIEMTKPTKKQ